MNALFNFTDEEVIEQLPEWWKDSEILFEWRPTQHEGEEDK